MALEGHTIEHFVGLRYQRCSAALYLTCEEWEVHVIRGHEVRLVARDEVAMKGASVSS